MYSVNFNSVLLIIGMVIIGAMFIAFYMYYISCYIKDVKSGNSDIEIIDDAIYGNLSQVKRKKKIVKTINSIAFYGLLLCIVPFFIFAIINKTQGNITLFGDKGVLAVASGSMSQRNPVNDHLDKYNLNNQFNTFDLIVVEMVDSEDDLELYDVVTYVDDKGRLIIHRIIEIKEDVDGETIYITRGDSNDVSDKPITFDRIKGEYIDFRIPFIGALILFFQSLIGIITIIVLIVCLFIVDKYNGILSKEKSARLKKLEFFDFENFKKDESIFEELIYYKGFMYKFNENGFVDKFDIDKENDYFEESNNQIIKVRTAENEEPKVEKYTIKE